MPRFGNMKVEEKSKDFLKTLKRLFNSLDQFKKLFLLALVLASLSSLLATIAPNRLSKITNIISDSIKPSTKSIEDISEKTLEPLMINNINILEFNKLSKDSKRKILKEFKYNKKTITVDEQIILLKYINTKDYKKNINKLPHSILSALSSPLDIKLIIKLSSILAIIYLLCFIFDYVQGLLMANISNKYAKRLRSTIITKINNLPLSYFDHNETGDILSRITNDIDSIGTNINQSSSTLISSLTLFIGSIIMMFVTNYIMAFTAILASTFGFILSFIILRKSQKYFIKRQEYLGKLNGHIEEMYSAFMVVKTYNGETEALEKFDTLNDELYDSNLKSQFLSGIMQPLMGFIGNFGYVAICILGAILVSRNHIGFGVIVAFMIYVRLFTNPLSQMAGALTGLQATAAAAERVFTFLDEVELKKETNTVYLDKEKVIGNIEFKNVNFSYQKNKKIIKDFTFNVKAGSKIAIVGPTGSGKTTLVNLLMKFYEINEGDILIDGVSIKDLTRKNIHELFVMVLQDTWLFEGSILDNIKFNNKIEKEGIEKICKSIRLEHFIKTLPNDFDYKIEDNEEVSSGERQLLTIARGMVKNAPFLILDEATSNVDTRTEEIVQKAMDKLMQGKTSFIIAHRLSTIKNADCIIVMKDGSIIEKGTHNELLNKESFYKKLYNSQFM